MKITSTGQGELLIKKLKKMALINVILAALAALLNIAAVVLRVMGEK